jgi:hypothetical protein
VIDDFDEIARAHEQINSFGFGDITQLTMDVKTKQEPVYPKMYMVPSAAQFAQNELIFNFQIIIADQLNADYTNQRDLMNDTLEICKDVFTILYLSEYESEWNATCVPFFEEYETILGGWTMNLQITQPFNYNRCNIPERLFDNKKWYELGELWNTISTDWKNT